MNRKEAQEVEGERETLKKLDFSQGRPVNSVLGIGPGPEFDLLDGHNRVIGAVGVPGLVDGGELTLAQEGDLLVPLKLLFDESFVGEHDAREISDRSFPIGARRLNGRVPKVDFQVKAGNGNREIIKKN